MTAEGTHMDHIPTTVGYFDVRTRYHGQTGEDARREIERYLYNGFGIVGVLVPPKDEDGYWTATVRFEHFGQDEARARFRVQYQRDRLSSGFYSTSEPVFYLPQPVEVSA